MKNNKPYDRYKNSDIHWLGEIPEHWGEVNPKHIGYYLVDYQVNQVMILVKKYHPDKLQHMDEAYQKGAREKFHKVQEAYETIQKERGL